MAYPDRRTALLDSYENAAVIVSGSPQGKSRSALPAPIMTWRV